MTEVTEDQDAVSAFEEGAAGKRRGLVRESLDWLLANKKWWLLPIVVAVLGLGVLVLLGGGSALSPFIYALY